MKDLQSNTINSSGAGHSPVLSKYVAPKDTQFRDVVIIGELELRTADRQIIRPLI